jgi:hypothetical protein
MKLFRCRVCDNIIYFENRTCGRCGHRLGYVPELEIMAALEPAGGEAWAPVPGDGGPRRFCANAGHDVCNWLMATESQERLCVACRHNDTIPDISRPSHLVAWREIELAKHRLFYSLLRWKLPLATRAEDPSHGLAFEFLADPHPSGPRVMTGHDDGVVTIALAEADSAEIERRRAELAEPYRSLLGHFRHEIGHHYWDILVRDGGKLDECRAIFGDDSRNYEAALKRHYEHGAPAGWPERFVSAYAASHPWEDFAETWAHYLHIVDTLETANAFGVRIAPSVDKEGAHFAKLNFDPYADGSIERIVEAWAPFVVAMNSVNRAMGRPDLYPFVIAPAVVQKLRFIHDLVRGAARCVTLPPGAKAA